MGLSIGTNSNIKKIELKNADGTVSGTIAITKQGKGKKKKLKYNFNEVASQLMRAKTSGNANQIAAKASTKVAMLRKMRKSGEYDDKDLEAAIIHAEQMARVAKKRVKHLQEEENIKTSGGVCAAELEEDLDIDWESLESVDSIEPNMEEMQELMQEFQEMMQDTMGEIDDSIGLDELVEELSINISKEMDPADLEMLKKKHRADELRDIAEANMKYLKAVFDKLEKEKRDAANGVSLELGGLEMPVTVQEPVVTESVAIDVTV